MAATMKRICIVGNSGAGKSTLARRLGERLGLPVVHLDVLFWKPDWTESEPAEFHRRTAEALAGEAWITDGNFTTVADLTLARCDTILWLEQPMLLCLWRSVARALKGHGRARPDMAAGCAEKIDPAFYGYIWTWSGAPRQRLERAIAVHGREAKLIRLQGNRGVGEFLAGLDEALQQNSGPAR